MPTGFRTVGNTCAGIADRSLGGMGGSDVYIDDAMGGWSKMQSLIQQRNCHHQP